MNVEKYEKFRALESQLKHKLLLFRKLWTTNNRVFCLKTIWRHSIITSKFVTEFMQKVCGSAAYSNIHRSALSLCIETVVYIQHENIKRRLVIRVVLRYDILFCKTEINHWLFNETLRCYSFHVYVPLSIEMNHNTDIQMYLLFIPLQFFISVNGCRQITDVTLSPLKTFSRSQAMLPLVIL